MHTLWPGRFSSSQAWIFATASVAIPRPHAGFANTQPASGHCDRSGVIPRLKSAKPTSPRKPPVLRSRTTQYPNPSMGHMPRPRAIANQASCRVRVVPPINSTVSGSPHMSPCGSTSVGSAAQIMRRSVVRVGGIKRPLSSFPASRPFPHALSE